MYYRLSGTNIWYEKMPGPANEETRRRTGLENPKGPDKNLQLAAEAQFISEPHQQSRWPLTCFSRSFFSFHSSLLKTWNRPTNQYSPRPPDHTKWATESELLGASHRFLRQFSENPFAGTKMREHDCQPVGDVPPADARRAPATEMRASAADEVKAEDEGVEQAAGSEPIAAFASILQKSGFDSETPVASSSASPVKVVTTQTAAFKLSKFPLHFIHS